MLLHVIALCFYFLVLFGTAGYLLFQGTEIFEIYFSSFGRTGCYLLSQ